jgi:outer membrane lipoprotein-sorting protein
MFCKKCGNMLDDDASFCAECGDPVTKSVPTNGITPPPVKPIVAVQQPYQYQGVTTQYPPQQGMTYDGQPIAPGAQPPAAHVKRKGKRLLIGILAVVVAVAAVTTGVFVYKYVSARVAARQTVEVTFRPTDSYKATRSEIDMTVSILKKRLQNMNITNRNIKVDYDIDSITVRFVPHGGITDANTEAAQLGSAAQIVFKSPEYDNNSDIITGKDVKSASVGTDSSNGNAYVVNITLYNTPDDPANPKVTPITRFDDATKALAALQAVDSTKGQLYIYLDTVKVEQAGVLSEITDGNTQISGGFTAASAKALADTINAGVMPFALEAGSISFPD